MDKELGLCYVRMPTWLPCRLQIYFNGYSSLAGELSKRKFDNKLLNNAFVNIGDWGEPNRSLTVSTSRDCIASWTSLRALFCPIHRALGQSYHWSMDQCEYATNIVFHKQAELKPFYENLSRTALHTVKPDNIVTFLGKKLSPQFEGEMGNRFNVRIEGTRIKHTMGPVSLKLYDKFGNILRIETKADGLSFFNTTAR
jgi:hypothetical protein